ncbi:hypothetical protein CDL12_12998 [Handroanthus impetiginosus]|uniref:J domain-containing protein n=1 Tax=Handroanthus impetiginosus TaxID=429701 RepID=A0A2G9HA77_9LAMI|nr:hypothetical protein CDL12_12998 [Handroanthus impetiginosus]
MEHCNREEAIIAKKMALEKMEKRDFMGARKYAQIAQKLCPDLENIVQMILVCDVHCYAAERECGNEMDWYKILQIEKTADEASIKRQYNRLALSLHPDKNRFPGAADAFQLIREAKMVLLDSEKRRWYDSVCQAEMLKKRRSKKDSVKKDSVVKDDADDMDDGVEIDCGVKRLKNISSFDVSAQEVDEQGKRAAKFASKTQENAKSCDDKSLPNVRISEVQVYSASGIALDAKILEYLAAEFNDFDAKRAKRCFGAGQVWAIYDTLDAMPRFYALITKVFSEDFKLQITWLEPYPHNANERKWLCQGLPTSCGKFKLGYTEIIEDHAIFSHLVTWRNHVNLPNVYEVHPRRGETWALFKNLDFEWYQNPERHKVYEFEVVEILSDYDSDVGVSIMFLRKMKGFTSLFCRVKEDEVDFEVIPVKDRFRLSHRVPSVEMKCKEGLNGIKRFFELDPASLPHDLSSH